MLPYIISHITPLRIYVGGFFGTGDSSALMGGLGLRVSSLGFTYKINDVFKRGYGHFHSLTDGTTGTSVQATAENCRCDQMSGDKG